MFMSRKSFKILWSTCVFWNKMCFGLGTSGWKHWCTFEVGICLWISLRLTFLAPSGVLLSDGLGDNCEVFGSWGTFEAHFLGLDHIFSTLGISSDIIGQHGQRIQIEHQDCLFQWGWTLLFVTATHCRKWTSYISLCYPMPTPRPLDLIDPVHAFVKLTSTVLEPQHSTWGAFEVHKISPTKDATKRGATGSFDAIQKKA